MFEQLRTLFPCEEPSDRPAQVTAGGTRTAPTAADHDLSPAPGTMEDKTPDWKRHCAVDELAAIVDEGLGQPAFMLGPDGRIVLWNEAMVALNGTPKEKEEETRQHTENITESIECLQSQTDESVETAVDSRDRIEAVTDLIDDLLGVFELITDLVEEVADEQTDGIDGPLSHVEELYDGMADD